MSRKRPNERASRFETAPKPTLRVEDEPPLEEETAQQDAALEELKEASSLASVPELLEFVREHPDVMELPEEVLEAVRGGKKLMRAYAEYENAKLREELTAQKQNRRNAESTPGSVSSDAGESDELEELLAVFDSVFR